MASVVDPARAQLITKAYRYKTVDDFNTRTVYPDAREISIETNLDEAAATALATALFDQTKTFARTFTVEVEDVFFLEDFTSACPRFKVKFGRHPAAGAGAVYTVIAAKVDFFNNRTILTVRG